MIKVRFYEKADDSRLKFAVIITKHDGKWVFCKHREAGETVDETARRELYEETGATDFDLFPVCVYSVAAAYDNGKEEEETMGMLYTAEVREFETELHSEIEKILITEELPQDWTYPEIQPRLIREMQRRENLEIPSK